jgi:uncharacterized membrane protein YobD (UPF0266 family)
MSWLSIIPIAHGSVITSYPKSGVHRPLVIIIMILVSLSYYTHFFDIFIHIIKGLSCYTTDLRTRLGHVDCWMFVGLKN